MTNSEIIKKMIVKAKENGFNTEVKINRETPLHSIVYPISFGDRNMFNVVCADGMYELWSVRDIIFSHEFAKAFWGEEETNSFLFECEGWETSDGILRESYEKHYLPKWEYHIQQMVLEDEPLKYLEKFL